jgi:hypothetical protein
LVVVPLRVERRINVAGVYRVVLDFVAQDIKVVAVEEEVVVAISFFPTRISPFAGTGYLSGE